MTLKTLGLNGMRFLKGFSLLELVFALMLLGIVASFAFRYIGIFYKNFWASTSVYEQQMDLDRTLLILSNRVSWCLKPSLIASKTSNIVYLQPLKWYDANISTLECALRDAALRRGYFFEDTDKPAKQRRPRWVGYDPAGQLKFVVEKTDDIKESNSTNTTKKAVSRPRVYDVFESYHSDLRFVNTILAKALNPRTRKEVYITPRYPIDIKDDHRQALGFHRSSSADVFRVKCPDTNCFAGIKLQMKPDRWQRFLAIDFIKRNIADNKAEFGFDFLHEALALKLIDGNLTLYTGFAPWQKITSAKKRTKPLTYQTATSNVLMEKTASVQYQLDQQRRLHFKICNSDGLCKQIKAYLK